jgi:hypothetical protein
MSSTIKYYKCEEIFAELPLWKAVPDSERQEENLFSCGVTK